MPSVKVRHRILSCKRGIESKLIRRCDGLIRFQFRKGRRMAAFFLVTRWGVDSISSASKLGLQFMDAKSRARLIHLLLSKSIAEALLIAAVAVAFFFATTNPGLRGVLDKADKGFVSGWAVDENDPASHVELQLFIDDKFIAAGRADQYRP